ncbi:hypothetical protein [Actinoplanes sp. G11-F43]|uniref:hypothetical protein n=1 Tax=Actinoplanes sp. G11-F43 TaxID=3424130 RepID=UPI003D32E866
MSRTPVSPDDADLDHWRQGGTTSAVLVAGPDRVTVRSHVDPETGVRMTIKKSVRLPLDLVEAAENAGHPDGFSGVVREALDAWLRADNAVPAEELAKARGALAVLDRFLARHRPDSTDGAITTWTSR